MKDPLFSSIVSSLSGDLPAPKKRPPGRLPRKRMAKEQQEFIDNYESKTARRQEPVRLIKALSLPPEQQRQALEDAMTPRQLAFCREYVLDFSTKNAALRAGYDAKNAPNTGYSLLQYRGIKKLIDIYTQDRSSSISLIDKDYIVNKIAEIVNKEGAKDGDKLRGLELLARHLGMFIERTEITGKDGEAIRLEETRKDADEVARQIRNMSSSASASKLSIIDGGRK